MNHPGNECLTILRKAFLPKKDVSGLHLNHILFSKMALIRMKIILLKVNIVLVSIENLLTDCLIFRCFPSEKSNLRRNAMKSIHFYNVE